MQGSVRQKNSRWYYRIYYTDSFGKRKQIERVGGRTKEEATIKLNNALKLYLGNNISPEFHNIKFSKVAEEYFNDSLVLRKLKNSTLEQYKYNLKRIQNSKFYNLPISQIKAIDIQNFLDDLIYDEKYSNSIISSTKSTLSSIFAYAIHHKQYIHSSPISRLLVVRNKEIDIFDGMQHSINNNVIDKDKFISLLDSIDNNCKWAILPMQLCFYAGLRIGEALGLCWEDINFKDNTITIKRALKYSSEYKIHYLSSTKNSKARVVPFGKELLDILNITKKIQETNTNTHFYNYAEELLIDGKKFYKVHNLKYQTDKLIKLDLICVRDNGLNIKARMLQVVCKDTAQRIGLDNYTMHNLRHSYATILIENGVSPTTVQNILGHSSVNTTLNLYVNTTKNDIEKVKKSFG